MSRTALALALAVVLLAALPSASGAKGCDPLDPRACLLPYPNDWFTQADPETDTGRRLALRRKDMPINTAGVRINPRELNRNDGFSPGQTIMTRVPRLDLRTTKAAPVSDVARSLARRAPIMVINARTLRRQLIWAELDRQATGDEVTLNIHPARNFRDGERYIVVLRDLKDSDGRTLRPDAAFRAIRDGRASGALAKRARRLEPVLDRLERAGIRRKTLYRAWDFTVASTRNLTERALAIRDDAFAQLGDFKLADGRVKGDPPAFRIDRVEELRPCGADGCQEGEDDRLLRIVDGTVTVPCYLDRAGCPPRSRFNYRRRGDTRPSQQPGNVIDAPFECVVPRAAQRRPARIALYGHGLLGAYREVRAGNVRDMAQEHDMVFCATYEIGMSEQDIAFAASVLQDLSLFPAIADRLQQGMLNGLYLGRLMIHRKGLRTSPAFAGLLDTSRLYYDSNSQGAIFGGGLAALAPDFTGAVLGVPGMNYSVLIPRSKDFNRFLPVMAGAYPSQLDRMLIFSMIQALWDRGETNGYANHITRAPLPDTPSKRILLEVALGDHQVTQIQAEVEARTIGARAYRPVFAPGRTWEKEPLFGIPPIRGDYGGSGIVFWDSGSPLPPRGNVPPRRGRDPHEDPRATPANRLQKSLFLRPAGVVSNVCGSEPCRAVQVP
jgi:hypothetical protein